MKLKVHLFDGRISLAQQLILLLWASVLVAVVGLWAPRGVQMLGSGNLSASFVTIAGLLGLLATFFALTQFMLMGRIGWIERQFGLDRLASYHRINGYLAISLIVIHPLFITLSHVVDGEPNIIAAYLSIFSQHPYTIWALVAEILFIAVVVSSIYVARRHLKFETWYFVHLMVYAAIVLASFHQFANGSSLAGSSFATGFWYGLYGFVALNLLIWRFGLPLYNFWRFDFTVSRVVKETPTVTSVYIKAKNLGRFKVKPGQFILVRIFAPNLWWQEHPFTVSWIPHGDELRISARAVGDYTNALAQLQPGAKVLVSGPFGRFTEDVAATDKRLFIAGGIGITPLRCLAEQAANTTDARLLYANRTPDDVPLKKELDSLTIATTYTYDRLDARAVKKLVPDFLERDVYLCGPPPMMASLIEQLTKAGLPPEQLHYERFALHN